MPRANCRFFCGAAAWTAASGLIDQPLLVEHLADGVDQAAREAVRIFRSPDRLDEFEQDHAADDHQAAGRHQPQERADTPLLLDRCRNPLDWYGVVFGVFVIEDIVVGVEDIQVLEFVVLTKNVIIVDDNSQDDTAELAARLGLHTIRHERNMGYGGNQKSCYAAALKLGADIVVMVHPDYQYTPRLIPVLASALAVGEFDVALGSRILSGGALKGGMPLYKYIANRLLTFVQNLFTGMKLSEYHTGYRAFTRQVLETLTLEHNSDDFLFDNQMLMQIDIGGFRIAEITCPTRYFSEASSIGLLRSIHYGLGCLWNSILHVLCRTGLYRATIFRHKKIDSPPDC